MAPASKNDGLEQVATRIPTESVRVLQLVAAAERKSMTDLLRPVLEEYAATLVQEPEVARMLEQADQWAERSSGVPSLPARRRGRKQASASSAEK